MTIKIFADWQNQVILTKEEYDDLAREIAEELRINDNNFSEFLEKNYSYSELWEADEEQRAKIMKHWRDKCLEDAYCELGFDEVTL